jgi:hypothetical protein
MRRIALFLLSSILTPATLAAGQGTCLLTTQIKVMNPLLAGDSTTGWTVISNSSGSCVARSIDMPLRPAVSRQTIASPLATKKPDAVAVVGSLLSRLGWESAGQSPVPVAPAGLRMKSGRSRGSNVADGVDPSYRSFSAERADNAVLRF